MRLSRRLAIGMLAAVMALSMTACGGGNASENPSSSGNNASSNSSSSASSGSNSSSSSSSASSDSNSQNQVTAVSRTDKYFKRLGVDPEKSYYYEKETLTGASRGTLAVVTSDGVRIGIKSTLPGFDFAIYDKRTKEQYSVWHNYQIEGTTYEKRVECSTEEHNDWPLIKPGTPVKATTHKVNGVEYYAEEITLTDSWGYKSTYYYCFDLNDTEGMNLRYIVEPVDYSNDSDEILDIIYRINIINNKAHMDMLRIPEGYNFYKWIHNDRQYVGLTPKDTYPN